MQGKDMQDMQDILQKKCCHSDPIPANPAYPSPSYFFRFRQTFEVSPV